MGWTTVLILIAVILTSIVLWKDLDRNNSKYIIARHSFKALWYFLLFIAVLAETTIGVNLLYSHVVVAAAWVEFIDNWGIRRRQKKLNQAIDLVEEASDEELIIAVKTIENLKLMEGKLIPAVSKIVKSEDLDNEKLSRFKETYERHQLESRS